MKHRFAIMLAVLATGLFATYAAAQYEALAGSPAPRAGAAQAVPTPRTPDGHPDLGGFWVGGAGLEGTAEPIRPDGKGNLTQLVKARKCGPGQTGEQCAPGVNIERDSTFTNRKSNNKPMYKPEFWERVQYLDENSNKEDPVFECQPLGVPRMGPPTKIVQTPTELIFLYQQGGASTAPQDFRVIPIDGRQHDPIRSVDTTYYGDSIGRWEGDTLVVDSVGFNDITWLAQGGYFHTNNMHVIERFTRQGNTITWQVTVDDPEVLMKPWTMDPRQVRLNPNTKAMIMEGLPCDERDKENMVTKEHH